MFKLEFRTDNSAFEGDLATPEIAAVIRRLADAIDGRRYPHGSGGSLYDANGNRIGAWSYEPSEDGEGQGDD